MSNKIRLIGCLIMGMFLLLQVSSFAQEPGRPMSNVKEETSDKQEQDSSKEAQYRKTPEMKGYTYNIKRLLEEIEENLQKVDGEIEETEVRKRNEEREAKVLEHFERGNILYKEGKLKEAKKEWRKALKISKDSEMKDYIKESEKRLKKQELARKKEEKERQRRLEAERKEKERRLNKQAKVFYDQALSLYKSKNYDQARVKFEQAAQVVAHYAKTDYYLRRIPEDIQREKERLEKERQKQLELEEKEKARKQKEEQARLEKEQREKESLEKERLRQEERARKEEINSLYKKATSLYNQDQLDETKVLFSQILSLDSNHQRAKDYLENKIPNRIEKIQEAKHREQERKLIKKKAAEVRRLKEEQKRIEAERKKAELEKKQALKKEIDSHYTKAISYYRDKSYDLAIQEFNKVLELNPQHKSVQGYLNKKIPARIEAEERAQKQAEEARLKKEKREKEQAKKERHRKLRKVSD